MTTSQPPRLATWLLQRWSSGPQRESLVGDLIEQYQRGRSSAWYWRQVLMTVVVGAARDIRDYKWLAVRLILGYYLFTYLEGSLIRWMYNSVGILVWNWTVSHGWDAARVAWFGRPRFPEPPLFALGLILLVMIGWAIARLHRGHVSAMVFTCALWVFLTNVTGALRFLGPTGVLRWLFMRPTVGVPISISAMGPLHLVMKPMLILLGGLWGSRPDHDALDHVVTSG